MYKRKYSVLTGLLMLICLSIVTVTGKITDWIVDNNVIFNHLKNSNAPITPQIDIKNVIKFSIASTDYTQISHTNNLHLLKNNNLYNNNIYFIIFLFLFFFVVSAVVTTAAQSFITIKGAHYMLLTPLILLFFSLVYGLPYIFQYNIKFLAETQFHLLFSPLFFFSISFGVDKISACFILLVTTIAVCALLYSRVYLANDANITDFMIKLVWFVISMILLVTARNFVFLYLTWEFIGITSAWLINYNSQRLDTLKSTLKAFSFNKISDLALFSGLLLLSIVFNSNNVNEWTITEYINTAVTMKETQCATFLILIAACTKSAQIGFHIWLPDSMDAPVPASALIHSATLVSAGVYLLLRFENLFSYTNLNEIISIVGAITAAYGGIVAALQTDLKRALAYSTISHCGFLFVSASLINLPVTLLYLTLHGIFKALSFICAGEYIRINLSYQDVNKSGSMFFIAPTVSIQFFVAMANLAGLPLFMGSSFKTSLQHLYITNATTSVIVGVGLVVGFLSSLFYFYRLVITTTFTFKKFSYKTQPELYFKNKKNFYYTLKSPKILIFIFWFLYISAFYSINFMNDYSLFTYEALDFSANSVNVLNPQANKQTFEAINYYFLFYSLYIFAFVYLTLSNPKKEMYPTALINKYTGILFFLFLFFIIC